jgi:hypothetical protein
MDSSDEDDDNDEAAEKNLGNSTRDYAAGMAFYHNFRETEVSGAQKPRWFGGFESAEKDNDGESRRATAIAPKRKHSKRRNETMIARQLQLMPTFTPYFIYMITFVQVWCFWV